VTFAVCESVGMFGFVIAGGLFAVPFPRRDRWKEWARQTAR
jgi:hypothetical protein